MSAEEIEPNSELASYRILSPTCGLRVSPLALGAMSLGQAWSSFMGSMDKEQAFKLLDAYFEAGGNFIDTACNYQDEEAETWIGEWMVARQNRDRMVIATKFTTDYKSYKVGKGKVNISYSRSQIFIIGVSLTNNTGAQPWRKSQAMPPHEPPRLSGQTTN